MSNESSTAIQNGQGAESLLIRFLADRNGSEATRERSAD